MEKNYTILAKLFGLKPTAVDTSLSTDGFPYIAGIVPNGFSYHSSSV